MESLINFVSLNSQSISTKCLIASGVPHDVMSGVSRAEQFLCEMFRLRGKSLAGTNKYSIGHSGQNKEPVYHLNTAGKERSRGVESPELPYMDVERCVQEGAGVVSQGCVM